MRKPVGSEQPIGPHHLFTSHEAASLLQADPSSINNWVRAGKLEAHRTPGGHRRIQAKSLARFVTACGLPVPDVLQGLAVPSILWVDGDASRRKRIQRLPEAIDKLVELRVESTLALGLISFGRHHPDALVLDGAMDDVPRPSVVVAARSVAPSLFVAYVDGQMTPDERGEARKLKVSTCLERAMPVRAVLSTVLEGVS